MTAELLRHPQPLGAFGFPAGVLLIPAGPDTDAARLALVAGRLPATWPESLEGHRLVHEGRTAEAAAFFAGSADPVSAYNHWVLQPDSADSGSIRSALPAAVAPLVDVVLGTGEWPDLTPAGEMAAEVGALVLASAATHRLERGGPATAETLLSAAEQASPHAPALAALLRGNAGAVLHDSGALEPAERLLTEALTQLADTDLTEVRAELTYRLGAIAQQRAAAGRSELRATLQDAMGHYYDALRLVSQDDAPELWATIQLNLAAAQLAVPMTQASDQLRMGVATQALRACRRVFTPEHHPAQWSTATLNLANALVYTPSTHPADNLVEAVSLYQQVLGSGVRDADPVGRARVLANLGNALAHLGVFDEAIAHLVEARFVFEEHLDHDAVLTVRSVLDEIARAQVDDPDPAALARDSEQLARMPVPDTHTSGMGVRIGLDPDQIPPRPATVTVVDPATRPVSP